MDDITDPCLTPHPDAAIRLASAMHRFPCPEVMTGDLSYERSFRTAGTHPTTRALTSQADEARISLSRALAAKGSKVSHQSIVNAAQNYIPLVHQILLSCKVQPESARLDQRLVFEWSSGMETPSKDKKSFKSEALMYELVMSISCEGMGKAGKACEDSTAGDFAAASRELKQAAGIMAFLAEDQLPQWIARGSNIEEKDLPSEASVGVCDSFKILFLAAGQQMAVATVLVKSGVPNYALLAKLSLGIAENIDLFMNTLRSEASLQMPRIDPNFFSLLTFQVNLQRGLSLYFLARHTWADKDYGIAISMLKEATSYLRTRDGPTSAKGLPPLDAKSSLKALKDDVNELRSHMGDLLKAYEKDNSKVYFDKVPPSVPDDKRLPCGIMMMKAEAYKLQDVEPAPLQIGSAGSVNKPPTPSEDADKEFARQLQEQLDLEDKRGKGGGSGGGLPLSNPPAPTYESLSRPPVPVPVPGIGRPPVPGVGRPPSPGLGRQKTDEELARELQDKLNAGLDG